MIFSLRYQLKCLLDNLLLRRFILWTEKVIFRYDIKIHIIRHLKKSDLLQVVAGWSYVVLIKLVDPGLPVVVEHEHRGNHPAARGIDEAPTIVRENRF